jgi:hypothetical protein
VRKRRPYLVDRGLLDRPAYDRTHEGVHRLEWCARVTVELNGAHGDVYLDLGRVGVARFLGPELIEIDGAGNAK